MNLLCYINVELGIDVQRLSGAQLVFQDANPCVERKLAKEDSSCVHKIGLVELVEL
jgi:hypothetical protein